MSERDECEQALGRGWVNKLLCRKQQSDDYGGIAHLPGKFGRNGLYSIRTQDTDYNCALPIVELLARWQSAKLPEREIIESTIGLTEEGTNPLDFYRGLLAFGIVGTYFEGMKPTTLRDRLTEPNMAYLIDVQALDTCENELMTALGGHLMVALCADENSIYMADPGWDYSTRYNLSELELLWYDRETRNGRWFVGSAIGIPITYKRVWY